MGTEKDCVKILMFPWVAHGHITPFIELAKKLSNKSFHFYICSTPVNLSSIKNKITENYIHLIELHLPTLPELPPHYHTTNGLPLHLHSTLRKALKMSKTTFSNLVKNLRPDLLIHDIMMPWAGVVAGANNIPTATFFTSGATMFSYFNHLVSHPGDEFPFPAMRLTKFELSKAIGNIDSYKSEEKDPEDEAYQKSSRIILVNTSKEIEGKYVDYVAGMINKKLIPIGALVSAPNNIGSHPHDDDSEIMNWLGDKHDYSTVFVSFGSEYFLKKDEILEIANGLELSKVSFIWIIRFEKGEEMAIDDALPKGFIERVGERGRIIEKWAPQAKILSHRSIGGFVSHCGWNSLKESIDYGVPIIGMPMHLDQPMNAKLVAELGVGVEVKRDNDNGKLQKEEMAKVINEVVNGKNGEILRRKVGEQRDKIRLRSRDEVEGVAVMLEQLCGKTTLS